jgi:hypothetical protein
MLAPAGGLAPASPSLSVLLDGEVAAGDGAGAGVAGGDQRMLNTACGVGLALILLPAGMVCGVAGTPHRLLTAITATTAATAARTMPRRPVTRLRRMVVTVCLPCWFRAGR